MHPSLLAGVVVVMASLTLASPALSQIAPAAATRHGAWFNAGLGMGSMGVTCDGCGSDRTSGVSGGLGIGGTISPRFLLGAQTAGWVKSENGATVNVSALNAVVRFYPSETGDFFFLGGLGYGMVKVGITGYGSDSENGTSAIFGLGYDIKLTPKASLTPFWNGYAVAISGGTANVGQIGLGVTIQ